jgi:Zn-dependent protease with chaperone function
MREAQRTAALSGVVALILTAGMTAQTVIKAPENKYSVADDVKLGQEAAQEVQRQLPIMRDDEVNSYLDRIGRRLVAAIPADLQHPEFRYSFTGVNVREINAFALPGGPMFINRGMMEKAHTEGEIAGVMAHELSHVALRHGTAQQTKATPYAVGQIAGAVLGAIVGGRTGSVIAQGTEFGLGAAFLRYSRDFERQADILGTHIMATAGYDPRDMANVFRTIEKESGSGGPQWLSDHPNPGNRYEYINQEAALLRVNADRVTNTNAFQNVQAHLRSLPPAPSTEEATKNGAGRPTSSGSRTGDVRPSTGRIERPASNYTTYNEGDLFRVDVPSNWQEIAGNNSVTFAPTGAYGSENGQSIFTHGVEIGIARNETHDLRTATDELIQSLAQSNSRLGRPSGYDRTTIGGLEGAYTQLSNVSDATGTEERVTVYTALLNDGTLFYILGVAPRAEAAAYEPVFRSIARSIEFSR